MDTISILGCGWLGLPLAKRLIDSGYKVKGSTRALSEFDSLEAGGIEPYCLSLDPDVSGEKVEDFLDSDILIINFPPERREDIIDFHVAQINSLVSKLKLSPISKIVFVSSTSVYPDVNREVYEHERLPPPSKISGQALLEVENILQTCARFKTTVIRFGGLIGYDRQPGRFLSGKKEIINGEAYVNLIHRDDCISIIHAIIEQDVWGEIFNACADGHPRRRDYYIAKAKELGLPPPSFKDDKDVSYKLVNSDKLKRIAGYKFKYPNPACITER